MVLTEPFIEKLFIFQIHSIEINDFLYFRFFLDDSAVAPYFAHFMQIFIERLSLKYTLMMLFHYGHILLTLYFFTFLKFVLG